MISEKSVTRNLWIYAGENMDESIQGLITSDMNMGEEELNDDETDYEYVLQTDQTVEILESL